MFTFKSYSRNRNLKIPGAETYSFASATLGTCTSTALHSVNFRRKCCLQKHAQRLNFLSSVKLTFLLIQLSIHMLISISGVLRTHFPCKPPGEALAETLIKAYGDKMIVCTPGRDSLLRPPSIHCHPFTNSIRSLAHTRTLLSCHRPVLLESSSGPLDRANLAPSFILLISPCRFRWHCLPIS